jgi:hypothetical protein
LDLDCLQGFTESSIGYWILLDLDFKSSDCYAKMQLLLPVDKKGKEYSFLFGDYFKTNYDETPIVGSYTNVFDRKNTVRNKCLFNL